MLPLEPLGFYRQQMFNVSTACEDAFQIDPTALHINPNIKESHDAIELVFPAQGIFLKHLGGKKKTEDDCIVKFLRKLNICLNKTTHININFYLPCSKETTSWQTRC